MFDRFDPAAQRVLDAAFDEAIRSGDDALATQHLLIALASSDSTTAALLAESGVTTSELRHAFIDRHRRSQRADHERLLSTLGVDLGEIRDRAEQTFGTDALAQAAARTRRRRPRRPLWSRISCSQPLPRPRCESPLGGGLPAPIPRVKRILERATRSARPALATPCHLLLVLIEGNEPACEHLAERDVDLRVLAQATRRKLDAEADRRRDH